MRSVVGVKCGAVVLAAGEARRFGSPKLLMPFGHSTVIGSVVHALAEAGIGPIAVVAGAHGQAIANTLSDQPAYVVTNPEPSDGMISSIRVGLQLLSLVHKLRMPLDPLDQFLIALGDQPRISPTDVSRLIVRQRKSGFGIAIPTYDGKRGHPVLFDIGYCPEILALTNEQTLRDLIDAHWEDVIEVDCDSDAYISDIDTREDYEHELRRWNAERQPKRLS